MVSVYLRKADKKTLKISISPTITSVELFKLIQKEISTPKEDLILYINGKKYQFTYDKLNSKSIDIFLKDYDIIHIHNKAKARI